MCKSNYALENVNLLLFVQVLIVAAILSSVFRKPEFSDVDDDPETMISNALPADDEEMIQIQTKSGW